MATANPFVSAALLAFSTGRAGRAARPPSRHFNRQYNPYLASFSSNSIFTAVKMCSPKRKSAYFAVIIALYLQNCSLSLRFIRRVQKENLTLFCTATK